MEWFNALEIGNQVLLSLAVMCYVCVVTIAMPITVVVEHDEKDQSEIRDILFICKNIDRL